MKLLALPGRNPETEAWMTALVSGLSLGQQASEVAHYGHWDTGAAPDVDREASRIGIQADDVVIGKSLGTLVLLTAAARDGYPAGAVFIGTPLRGYPPSAVTALQRFAGRTPSLFIQQTADIAGSFEDLERVVSGQGRETLVEVAGSDHVYSDTESLCRIIRQWWPVSGDESGG